MICITTTLRHYNLCENHVYTPYELINSYGNGSWKNCRNLSLKFVGEFYDSSVDLVFPIYCNAGYNYLMLNCYLVLGYEGKKAVNWCGS